MTQHAPGLRGPEEPPEFPRLHDPTREPEEAPVPPRKRKRSASRGELLDLREQVLDLRERNLALERKVASLRRNVRSGSMDVLSQKGPDTSPNAQSRPRVARVATEAEVARDTSANSAPLAQERVPENFDIDVPRNAEQVLALIDDIAAAKRLALPNAADDRRNRARIDAMFNALSSLDVAHCSSEKAATICTKLNAMMKFENSDVRLKKLQDARARILSATPPVMYRDVEKILSRIRLRQAAMYRMSTTGQGSTAEYMALFDALSKDYRELQYHQLYRMRKGEASKLLVSALEVKSGTLISGADTAEGAEHRARHQALDHLIAQLKAQGATREGFFNGTLRWFQRRGYAKERRRVERGKSLKA